MIIGIAGGTGSGKTTVVKKIMGRLNDAPVTVIPQDNYYKDNSDLPMEERHKQNFDHPDSIEFSLLAAHIDKLKSGQGIQMPMYSYLTCTRAEETVPVTPMKVIIVEGILVLSQRELRQRMDLKIYVDCDDDDRLIRCIHRDILERGRDVKSVLERYEKTVKPMHIQFVEPSKRYADVIITQGGNNEAAVDMISAAIGMKLS